MILRFQNEPIALRSKRTMSVLFVVFLMILLSFILSYSFIPAQPLLAHGDEDDGHIEETTNINLFSFTDVDSIRESSIQIAKVSGGTLIALVFIAFLIKNRGEYTKKVVFTLIVITIVVPTIYFISSTVYINLISESGGPVHWHADYQIFVCGEELHTASPEGRLSNKTGTTVLHEHNDNRIHVEGVILSSKEASLSNFFAVQGGELTQNSFTIPTEEGMKQFVNGDSCSDGSIGVWQTFLYKTDGNFVEQTKLENYTDYILTPAIDVPPGDCIILEFGPEKEKTENICDFYTIELNKGNLEFK